MDDIIGSFGRLGTVALAMALVVGGVLLVFVLTAAKRARDEVIEEERDRRDD